MTAEATRNPEAEIAADNPWYTEDQFAVQIGSPAFRPVVENRWRVFASAIDQWARDRGTSPARLLDAGCGDGINLEFLARLARTRGWPAQIVGADYSPLRLGRARLPGTPLARTSVTSLGLADGSFDVIVCNQVLEHVPDDHAAFGELFRVLRPGGLLIVGVPNEGSWLGLLRNHFLQRSILHTTDHVNMYTQSLLRERMTAAGFVVVRLFADGFFIPHTRLHAMVYRSSLARQALGLITRVAPACAAGLIVTAVRPL